MAVPLVDTVLLVHSNHSWIPKVLLMGWNFNLNTGQEASYKIGKMYSTQSHMSVAAITYMPTFMSLDSCKCITAVSG